MSNYVKCNIDNLHAAAQKPEKNTLHNCTPKMTTSQKSVTKCKNLRCATCPYLKLGPSFDIRLKEFHISCYSQNFIYVITRAGCDTFYIGDRFQFESHNQSPQTTYSFSRVPKIKLTEHIYVCRHGQFQEFPFYKLLSDNNIERREK